MPILFHAVCFDAVCAENRYGLLRLISAIPVIFVMGHANPLIQPIQQLIKQGLVSETKKKVFFGAPVALEQRKLVIFRSRSQCLRPR
jgi:hypothetical protein